MNFFGKGRKAKEQAQADGSIQPDVSNNPSKLSRSLKRKQKNAPEPQPELNIALALPDKNDFRTSLMLPGLSERFSMLREPTDPNSLIGKANDDSVLFPSRASRLNLFKHNPLTDISEVESIYSFRPPFADTDRSLSISEGYASDDGGSIMNRNKPIDSEGNNLFSGRQKLYRVPDGTSSNATLPETRTGGLGGRHVYSNDVTASMFRGRSRSENRSEEQLGTEQQISLPEPESDEASNANSPITPFSKNRGTTSSTTSGPSNGRTSTAATSIASESPAIRQSSTKSSTSGTNPLSRISDQSNMSTDRATTQKRPFVHGVEHPAPSLPTVDDILGNANTSRTPVESKPSHRHKLSQSRSATTLKDLNSPPPSVFTSSAFRAASPPPSTTSPLKTQKDNVAREETRSPSPRYGAVSPTAAFGDGDTFLTYNRSVQPGDRGKATALGLFNKPQRQFDEQQFSQRQLQMHEGQISPVPVREPSSGQASRVASPEPFSLPHQSFIKPQTSGASTKFYRPTSPVLSPESRPSGRVSPVFTERISNGSSIRPAVAGRPRKQSSASTANPALVEARTKSLIKQENAKLAKLEAERNVSGPLSTDAQRTSHKSSAKSPIPSGTFFNNFDNSDDESESMLSEQARQSSQSRRQPSEVHPALRDGLNDFIFDDSVTSPKMVSSPFDSSTLFVDSASGTRNNGILTPIPSPSEEKQADSPTLPVPGLGLGLGGMIHSHLRNDSERSSVYPEPSPQLPQDPYETSRKVSMASTDRTLNPPGSIRSDPWELDIANGGEESPRKTSDTRDPALVMSQRAQQMRDQAAALKNQSRSKAQQILGNDAPEADIAPEANSSAHPWLDDRKLSHQRQDSTLTQKEREEFEEKVAESRRAIQQKFGRADDGQGPSMGPGPQYGRSPGKNPRVPGYPFPDQRSDQFVPDGQFEHSQKAMKMLGINGQGQGPARRQPSPRIPQDDPWREEEERMLQDHYSRRPKPRSPPEEAEYRSRPDRPMHAAPARDGSGEDMDRSRMRSATPNSGRPPPGRRNRGMSEAGARSRSRAGAYREDEERGYGRPMEGPPRGYSKPRAPLDDPYYRGPSRGPGDRAPSRGPGDHAPSRGPVDPRTYERSASAASGRYRSNSRPNGPGYMENRPPPIMPQANGNMPFRPPRPAPQPIIESPMSPHPPQRPFDSSSSPAPSATNSPTVPTHGISSTGRTTPTSTGRTTPNLGGRKKSVNKNMISEPTFLSSTSSVPLVGLPGHDASSAAANNAAIEFEDSSPPIPAMNPRRRQTATASAGGPPPQNPFQFLRPDLRPAGRIVSSSVPQSPMSPMVSKYGQLGNGDEHTLSDDNAIRVPKQRNRLRKTSSEGGSMAAKARNQAILGELRGERLKSPAVPNFDRRNMGGVGGGMTAGSRNEVPLHGVREGEMF